MLTFDWMLQDSAPVFFYCPVVFWCSTRYNNCGYTRFSNYATVWHVRKIRNELRPLFFRGIHKFAYISFIYRGRFCLSETLGGKRVFQQDSHQKVHKQKSTPLYSEREREKARGITNWFVLGQCWFSHLDLCCAAVEPRHYWCASATHWQEQRRLNLKTHALLTLSVEASYNRFLNKLRF